MILCICFSSGLYAPNVYAKDDSGNIDLYQAFSSEEDRMKTEVGSRIYKWSMHLPDDGTIYKSEQANFFNMSTNSYQANIQLTVDKNKENTTLEEMLYQMQNQSIQNNNNNMVYSNEKDYVMNIDTDDAGQKFIRVIKADQFYDYYMVNEAAQEFSDYIENRIYIANGYIYNLTVSMKGEFYKQHEEMFDKLVSSFKVSFDDNNQYIKELSDSVSTTREYKNTSYGWKMTMSPYWRVNGIPNARIQNFSPVYTDEELNMSTNTDSQNDTDFKVPEGVTVSLISSADKDETAAKWAQKEIENFKNNNNDKIYEILSTKENFIGDFNSYDVVIRNKSVTSDPYVVHNLYIIGNGYKYLVTATMKEEKYDNVSKRNEFDSMLSSFTLDKSCISKYLGEILSADSILDVNASKELKMNKYDFSTTITKGWNVSRDANKNDQGQDYNDQYPIIGYSPDSRGDVSNNEYVGAIDPVSNMHVDMTAGLNANEIDEIVKQNTDQLLKNDEVQLGLANVKIQSAEYDGAQIYCIEKEYDLDAILAFVKSDTTKKYDFERLQNQYEYIVKVGKDTFIENITLPVENATDANKAKADEIWQNTSINKNSYGKAGLSWKDHKLEEFSGDDTSGSTEK